MAALSRVLVRTLYGKRGGAFDIGVIEHDQRIVAAEFKHHSPVPRLRGDRFAYRHAAGKSDQFCKAVRDEFVGDLARIAGQDLQHRGGQTGFVEHIREVISR